MRIAIARSLVSAHYSALFRIQATDLIGMVLCFYSRLYSWRFCEIEHKTNSIK